jgi:predicted RNA binding protein YcfA (HicA-like mRNA interferase family)
VPKIPVISVEAFLQAILKYGCILVHIKGSHHKVMNPVNGAVSIIPVHSGKDMAPGLFAKVLKDLNIDIADFIKSMED